MVFAAALLWALGAQAQTDSSLDRLFDRTQAAAPAPAAAGEEAGEALSKPIRSEPRGPLEKLVPAVAGAQPQVSAQEPKPGALAPGEAEAMAADLAAISRRLLESGQGNPKREDMHALLVKLSKAPDEDKMRFIEALTDPAAIYVSIALSRAPHSFEAHLMSDRFQKLLKGQGIELNQWIAENQAERWSGLYYLRLSAYDRLGSYLKKHPTEAEPVLGRVFAGVGSVPENAPAIQALMEQATARGSNVAVGEALARGALPALDSLRKDRAKQLALLLMLYRDHFGSMTEQVEARASMLVPEGSYLSASDEPMYELWPAGTFKAAFHFADRKDYERCLAYFLKKGYLQAVTAEDQTTLVKKVAGREVTLVWKVYKSNDEGFMDKAEVARFQDAVRGDLRDPELQGVFLRSHPDFSYTRMFKDGADAGKIFFDGSCRGIWAFARLEGYCPECLLIGNAGGGSPQINDGAGYELIEGLARQENLTSLRERLSRTGRLSRFLGPWDPPYYKALKKLK